MVGTRKNDKVRTIFSNVVVETIKITMDTELATFSVKRKTALMPSCVMAISCGMLYIHHLYCFENEAIVKTLSPLVKYV